MRIVVISPESRDPREIPAVGGFLAAGLQRYHVRKPAWSEPELEAWMRGLPPEWRPRIVLHGHRALAERLGLGGWHDGDASPDAVFAPGADRATTFPRSGGTSGRIPRSFSGRCSPR